MLQTDEPVPSGDFMGFLDFCGRSLRGRMSGGACDARQLGYTHVAFPVNSAIWEYLQSVDRLTHAVQLGRLLSHLA